MLLGKKLHHSKPSQPQRLKPDVCKALLDVTTYKFDENKIP